jgi:hypothetical protein
MSVILNEDGSEISFPNRSKFDSLKIFEDYLPVMSKLENIMRDNPSKKFFMPYEAIPSYMLQDLHTYRIGRNILNAIM